MGFTYAVQVPRGDDRTNDVVSTLDDHAGNVANLVHVSQQLVIHLEEALVGEVVALRRSVRGPAITVSVGSNHNGGISIVSHSRGGFNARTENTCGADGSVPAPT